MKRIRVIVILVSVLLLGWFAFYLARPTEPVYEGRTLTEWLKRYEADSVTDHGAEYERAIRAIGTNGIPILLTLLTEKDSPGVSRAHSVLGMLGFERFHPFDTEYKHRLASLGFQTLGEEAKVAVPKLIELTKASNAQSGIRIYALWALEKIKPEKEIILPILMQSSKDADQEYSRFADQRLRQLYPEEAAKIRVGVK